MRIGVGHSDDVDGVCAIAAAMQQAAAAVGEAPVRGALLLISVEYDAYEALAAVRARWPELPIIGCTTDGEMSSVAGFADDSVLLVLFAGNDIEVAAGLAERVSDDPQGAPARAIAHAGLTDATLCLTTPVSNTCNLTAVVEALTASLPAGCPIVGGTAGDHMELTHIRELFGDQVYEDALPVLLLRGPIHTHIGIGSGWTPAGREYRVTAATGHRIHELDGQPATDIYERHWGPLPRRRFTEFPLAVYPEDGSDHWVLRAVFSSQSQAGSLVCAAEVPTGARVRITEVHRGSILEGARESAAMARESWSGPPPAGAFVVSCTGRRWLLGTRAAAELEVVREALGWPEVPIFGFCSFGEIVREPHAPPRFHNQTCVVAVFGHG